MLNPIVKFKVAILHLNSDWNHWNLGSHGLDCSSPWSLRSVIGKGDLPVHAVTQNLDGHNVDFPTTPIISDLPWTQSAWNHEVLPLKHVLNSSLVQYKSCCITLLYGAGKEYVASLIGLYKNNGAVSCVAINFLLILIPLHETAPLFLYKPMKLATYSLEHVHRNTWKILTRKAASFANPGFTNFAIAWRDKNPVNGDIFRVLRGDNRLRLCWSAKVLHREIFTYALAPDNWGQLPSKHFILKVMVYWLKAAKISPWREQLLWPSVRIRQM